ncbi:MAG: ATPase/DNA packaging protein [Terriglobales bacterium]
MILFSRCLIRMHWDELEVFDPYEVPPNFSCIAYGARGSGKSSWIAWMAFYRQHDYKDCYVFSSTSFIGFYQAFMPEHHVFTAFDEKICQMIVDNKKTNGSGNVMIVLDDVLDSMSDIRRSKSLITLFTYGRHFNIAVIVATQYPLALPPCFRRNVDVAVIFGSLSVDTWDQQYKEYGFKLSRAEFDHLCDRYCFSGGYKALIVLPTKKSADVKDLYKYTDANPAEI